MIAQRVIFEGRVQGIGFRYTVKDLARSFDVCGSVKNLADGSVQLEVMGAPYEVAAFLREITHESPVAHNIQHHGSQTIPLLENRSGFRIER